MTTVQNQQGFVISETLYVQPGTRQCRIFAIKGSCALGNRQRRC